MKKRKAKKIKKQAKVSHITQSENILKYFRRGINTECGDGSGTIFAAENKLPISREWGTSVTTK